jgi:hypothetical protein
MVGFTALTEFMDNQKTHVPVVEWDFLKFSCHTYTFRLTGHQTKTKIVLKAFPI